MSINLSAELDANLPSLTSVFRSWLGDTSDCLVARVAEIDEQLRLIGRTLDDLQPRLPGRVQICWWRDRHYPRRDGEPAPSRPYIVRVERNRMTREWYQREVPLEYVTLRVSPKSEFAAVAPQVRELLSLAAELIEYRLALWKQVRKAAELKNRFERNNGERLERVKLAVFRLAQSAANDEVLHDERCAVAG